MDELNNRCLRLTLDQTRELEALVSEGAHIAINNDEMRYLHEVRESQARF